MKKSILRGVVIFLAGAASMFAVVAIAPSRPAQAPVSMSNDKFSMVTVQSMETGNHEVVFVLNHLTGVLAGGSLHEQTGKFTQLYLHNVAADFQSTSKDPKYAIVTGPVNLQSPGGGVQIAYGVIYVAELSSGAVIAYTFPRPSNRNAGTTLPLAKLDFFKFADSVGQ